jgi:1-acyl-sn-glycerol-3-phosphate acyltransferase
VGTAVLALLRWRVDGNFPDLRKFVVIVAPHTSNWDFVVGIAAYLALEIGATWFGKHTLFRWPLGPLLRSFGGIPVVRNRPTNVVDLYVAEFARRDRMVLAIAPEGTRSRVTEWKTGFYRIALGAGVPIVPVAFDFGTRAVRIFPPFAPTGNLEEDVAHLRGLFDRSMARHAGLF